MRAVCCGINPYKCSDIQYKNYYIYSPYEVQRIKEYIKAKNKTTDE